MDTEIDYTERVVALIDILGFKEAIKKIEADNGKSVLADVLAALSYLQDTKDKAYNTLAFEFIGKRLPSETTEVATFSDHIVVSDTLENLTSVLFKAATISRGLLLRGLLCRGAVTYGKFYHNNAVLFGNALLEALEIESTKAIYPRIVASDQIVAKYAEFESTQKINLPKRLRQDTDGVWFIPPFAPPFVAAQIESFFAYARKFIVDGINAHPDNPRIIEKYRWLAAQFNQSKYSSTPIDIMDTYRSPSSIK